ncbi:MAG: tetratricopeptide repeat protein [Myxococcota bacterium]
MGCPPTISSPQSRSYTEAFAAGRRHLLHERHPDAEASFRKAAEHAGRRVDEEEALYLLARVLQRADRKLEALRVLERLAARRPVARRTVRALYDAARIQHALGSHAVAVDAWKDLIATWPSHGLASSALKNVLRDYRRREALEAAQSYLAEMYETLGDTPIGDNLLISHARLKLEAGEDVAATALLERLVRDHPYPQGHLWDDAIWMLVAMEIRHEHYGRAVHRLDRMLQRAESTTLVGSYTLAAFPRASLEIARIYRDRLENFEKAARYFMKTYTDFPNSTLRDDALTELGLMSLEAGRTERGCRYLSRVLSEFEVGSAFRRAKAVHVTRCPEGLLREAPLQR